MSEKIYLPKFYDDARQGQTKQLKSIETFFIRMFYGHYTLLNQTEMKFLRLLTRKYKPFYLKKCICPDSYHTYSIISNNGTYKLKFKMKYISILHTFLIFYTNS